MESGAGCARANSRAGADAVAEVVGSGRAWHHAHSVTGPLGGRRPCISLSRRSISVPMAFLERPRAKLADRQRSKGPTKAGTSLQAGTGRASAVGGAAVRFEKSGHWGPESCPIQVEGTTNDWLGLVLASAVGSIKHTAAAAAAAVAAPT